MGVCLCVCVSVCVYVCVFVCGRFCVYAKYKYPLYIIAYKIKCVNIYENR